jgi:signal transduction histidine kinase
MGAPVNRSGHLGPRTTTDVSPIVPALAIAVGYYIGAKVGFALTLAPVPVSTLWPPNAILLAGLLLTPTRSWALVLLAVFGAHLAVQFQSGVPTGMVLSWYVSNCAEALLGAGLLRRLIPGAPTFATFRETALFLACAGFVAPFISSFLDAWFVILNAWGESTYWNVWRTRFFSNVLATITLVPFIITTAAAAERVRAITARKWVEGVAGMAALAAVCWVVFVVQRPGPSTLPVLLYAPLPLLVGAAVRFGPWGASTALLICALTAIWGAGHGQGPFATSSPAENAIAIQLFLIIAWIPVMSLAAVIQERAHADAKARWSEEELAIAIDAAQLGRWDFDIQTGTLTWSDTTRRMYEVPLDVPVLPDMFHALVHPDDRPLIAAAMADGQAGRGVDVEFRVVFPDGRIKWILSKGKTVFDADGRAVRMVGVKMDLTARRAAELQIQEQGRRLAHRAGVSVAGELSVALAHELNQPLAAILANAAAARRFLLHEPPDLNQLKEIVDAISDDNRRAAAVITRVGALLKKSDARWAPVDTNDVVNSVIDIARGDIISRGVSLTRRLEDGLPPVFADAVQLQQVVLNLIINACDAMDAVPEGFRRLLIMTAVDGPKAVRVTVADSGAGVPADRIEEVFEPFVTSKPQRLGLGLAICRSIISAHDGRLWVESQPESGASFSFSLPAMGSGGEFGAPVTGTAARTDKGN